MKTDANELLEIIEHLINLPNQFTPSSDETLSFVIGLNCNRFKNSFKIGAKNTTCFFIECNEAHKKSDEYGIYKTEIRWYNNKESAIKAYRELVMNELTIYLTESQ